MKTTITLAVITALSLTGCTPDKFTSAPVVDEYFHKQLPTLAAGRVEVVSVCQESRSEKWMASILFEDDTIYTYDLNPEEKVVSLNTISTEAERDIARSRLHINLGCIGYYEGEFSAQYTPYGKYRVHVYPFLTRAYVWTSWLVSNDFGPDDKLFLDNAALATKDAIARHQVFRPHEETWGVVTNPLTPEK